MNYTECDFYKGGYKNVEGPITLLINFIFSSAGCGRVFTNPC